MTSARGVERPLGTFTQPDCPSRRDSAALVRSSWRADLSRLADHLALQRPQHLDRLLVTDSSGRGPIASRTEDITGKRNLRCDESASPVDARQALASTD